MIAKALLLCAAVAAVQASVILNTHLINTGVSTSSRHQDTYGNYVFGYDIKDGLGVSNSRSEVGDAHGNKKGSYTIADIDGRARRVDYVADGHGFRAVVKTNEPGTAASASAASLIDSPYAAPVVNHIAPTSPSLIGHITAPLDAVAPAAIGHVIAPLAISAPLAYGDVLSHETGLGYGAIIENNLGLGIEKAVIY
ncbi:adult-specific rigid cuticular protein 15.7-like [Argiope bruennichi]|uniref:adult-specific rigid cuticular protein 15.7-like n=1 Tax=Argiope bruennichi TaxID=94029 RepID=UPI002494955C|nr:adult-specific rigid cuticular protein 15.7-like [Argiope bruennichi]